MITNRDKNGRVVAVELTEKMKDQIVDWGLHFSKSRVITLIELNYNVSKPTAYRLYRLTMGVN